MEDRKEEVQGNSWMSVPAFGDWDQKNGVPDYSVDFTKIREMRKQNKQRASLGNEDELIPAPSGNATGAGDRRRDNYGQLPHSPTATDRRDHSPTARKRIASYFTCCIGA